LRLTDPDGLAEDLGALERDSICSASLLPGETVAVIGADRSAFCSSRCSGRPEPDCSS
jgi:hypothetical protein